MCGADSADITNAFTTHHPDTQPHQSPRSSHFSAPGRGGTTLCLKIYTDFLSTMATEENGEPARSYFVGKKKDLIQAKRTSIRVADRDIMIIHQLGVFYAMDQHCYHAGGSLLNGDIEDIDSKLCIVCPKHKYKISLAEGEGLYKACNPKEKTQSPRWFSKGIKQRVHQVTEEDEDVFVTLSEFPQWVESDYYQGEKGREELKKALESEKAKGTNC